MNFQIKKNTSYWQTHNNLRFMDTFDFSYFISYCAFFKQKVLNKKQI